MAPELGVAMHEGPVGGCLDIYGEGCWAVTTSSLCNQDKFKPDKRGGPTPSVTSSVPTSLINSPSSKDISLPPCFLRTQDAVPLPPPWTHPAWTAELVNTAGIG